MAAGLLGEAREPARLRNSEAVFACWSLTVSTTGPLTRQRECWPSTFDLQTTRRPIYQLNKSEILLFGYLPDHC